jgi:hypothetical protein
MYNFLPVVDLIYNQVVSLSLFVDAGYLDMHTTGAEFRIMVLYEALHQGT